jgi:nucleoside-triphosphatase THEP1
MREPFLRVSADVGLKRIGKFSILPKGIQLGSDVLKVSNNLNNQIVVIDEVGRLEIDDHGWAGNIQELLNACRNHLLLVVRDSFFEEVIQKWNLRTCFVYNISEKSSSSISEMILDKIR